MLGCIGVATAGDEVMSSGPAGSHGGNMDYNDIVEGATLYFPVFHKGAYFYVGDGHAVQGDGEGLGNGVETSLDVQFTVKVHKNKKLSMPRLVNDEYIVSIGSQPEFHSSMDFALRAANADMLQWLTSEYKLTAPEANLLFGAVVQHKIATYFGTVTTLIPRKYLPKADWRIAQWIEDISLARRAHSLRVPEDRETGGRRNGKHFLHGQRHGRAKAFRAAAQRQGARCNPAALRRYSHLRRRNDSEAAGRRLYRNPDHDVERFHGRLRLLDRRYRRARTSATQSRWRGGLGLKETFFLNYPNHNMDGWPILEMRARLVFLFRLLKVDTVLVYDPSALYERNPDHYVTAPRRRIGLLDGGFGVGLSGALPRWASRRHGPRDRYYYARGPQLVNRVVDIGPYIDKKVWANMANVTQGPAGNNGAELRKKLAEKKMKLALLGNDDETANRQYTKQFALGRDRVRGQAHGLEYAEYFHYVPPDESDVETYVSKNAVPL